MTPTDKKAPAALTAEASITTTDSIEASENRQEIKRIYVQHFLHAARIVTLQAIAAAGFYWFFSLLFEVKL
jgi:hypothetical protein